MSTSAARQRATAKYNAKTYDRLEMKVPKGEKNEIVSHAEKFDGRRLPKILQMQIIITNF